VVVSDDEVSSHVVREAINLAQPLLP
jgi:hypothetical protein